MLPRGFNSEEPKDTSTQPVEDYVEDLEDLPEEPPVTIRPTRRVTKRPKRPKPTPTTLREVTITPQEDPINEENVDYDNNLQSFAVEPVIQHQEQSAFDSTFRTSASSSSLFFQPSAIVSPNSLNTGIVRPPPGFSSSSQPSSGTCQYICQLSGGCSVRIQTTGFINFVS